MMDRSFWEKRTTLEVILFLIFTIFFVAITISVFVLDLKLVFESDVEKQLPTSESLKSSRNTQKVPKIANRTKICLTPSCVHAASKILDTLDLSVDPCEDFYHFACGKFIKETVIPDDKTSVSVMNSMTDRVKDQLRNILEEPVQSDEPKPYRLAKQLYNSCVNKDNIEEQGLAPILDAIRTLGGWPVLEGRTWSSESYNWLDSVVLFREHGFPVDYLMDFSVNVDLKNSSRRIINVSQAVLSLGREYLIKSFESKNKTLTAYYQYQVNVATALGADRRLAEKEMMDATLFEMKLANISQPNAQRRNASKLFNPMTIADLQNSLPGIPWLQYFKRLIGIEITFDATEKVNVDALSYIKQLELLLHSTPKRVQANYSIWRAILSVISCTPDHVRAAELKYSGKSEREPKWKECVDVVNNRLHHAVGSLYLQNFFQEDDKNAAQQMADNIKAESVKIIMKLSWMDDDTRMKAMQKAELMNSWIAYPEEQLNITQLEEYYKDLELSADSYLQNMLNVTLFLTGKSFAKLRKSVVTNDWTQQFSTVVNAYYSQSDNSIHIPAGILQSPFFFNDRPKYLNYGAIGCVIGHEITHAFDDQGRQFDKNGVLLDWWAKNTEQKFLKKVQCIVEQYGNYTVQEVGLKINGINTQGENIADNGGIKLAYRAYLEWVKQNGEELSLPGLNFKPRQLFWISAASIWCAKYRVEALRLKVVTDIHSPKRYRVIGSFSNMEDFAKDWKCPVGSKMNPTKKCVVW